MKRAFLRTAFVISVLFLWMVLSIPSMAALDAAFPVVRGPDGLYRGGDRMWVNMVPLFACGWVANRLISCLFWYAGLSEDRWSVFQARRSWRAV
jgi:hypothetical protein